MTPGWSYPSPGRSVPMTAKGPSENTSQIKSLLFSEAPRAPLARGDLWLSALCDLDLIPSVPPARCSSPSGLHAAPSTSQAIPAWGLCTCPSLTWSLTFLRVVRVPSKWRPICKVPLPLIECPTCRSSCPCLTDPCLPYQNVRTMRAGIFVLIVHCSFPRT